MRGMRRARGACGGAALSLALSACGASQALVGRARPPISPADVRLYLEPPGRPYESIAILDVSSKHALAFTAEGKAQIVIRRLKESAARLGANGVLLEQIADDPDATALSGGVGTQYWGSRGTIDLGMSAALAGPKFGRGTAIYLPPEPGAPAGR